MTELEKAAILLADGDRCHYDHHGYCQTHFLHDKPCPMEVINTAAKEQNEKLEALRKVLNAE